MFAKSKSKSQDTNARVMMRGMVLLLAVVIGHCSCARASTGAADKGPGAFLRGGCAWYCERNPLTPMFIYNLFRPTVVSAFVFTKGQRKENTNEKPNVACTRAALLTVASPCTSLLMQLAHQHFGNVVTTTLITEQNFHGCSEETACAHVLPPPPPLTMWW